MPVSRDATIEITAFNWVPEGAYGLVRDLRVRWALEEIGQPYRVRLLHAGQPRPEGYYSEQPFGQVPTYHDGAVHLFESGAILIHIGEKDERLLPRDQAARARAIGWLFAALNSVEPAVAELFRIDLFCADTNWAPLRRPSATENVQTRLQRLSDWLGEQEWLEGQFTVGDIMMVTVLRFLRHTDLVAAHPNLAAYLARAEARPAFQAALADQMAGFASETSKVPA